jgi:ribosomal protein L24
MALDTNKPTVKMYKLTVHSGENEGDKGDVVLVHNYKQIQIMRDVEVEVSENYINCLKYSNISTQIKDDKGNVKDISIPRYSYSASPV